MHFASDCHASSIGFMRLESPHKQYTLLLVPNEDPEDWEDRELRVFRGSHELARYRYQGVLVKAYWLLSRKLVVLDNINGEAGYGILVVSLADGSIITSHGPANSPEYDRLNDRNYLPDLFAAAHAQMQRLYKDVDNDHMRHGYEAVAYGWTPEQRVKVFARFPFEGFGDYVFQVYANLEITDQQKMEWRDVSVRKVKCDSNEPQPAEVTRLDSLLD